MREWTDEIGDFFVVPFLWVGHIQPIMTLNPQQQKAVEHSEGPLLILAGAGSGKTRVLTSRIASLIEKGVAPQQILAVTFTNKASREMKRRLEDQVGPRVRDLWVGTFHSISLKILRKHSECVGLSPHFAIYDENDQLSLLRQIVRDLNLDEKRFAPSTLVHRISRHKDQLLSPSVVATKAENPFSQKVAEIYRLYEENLNKCQVLDFGDLILKVVQMFEKNPKLLEQYQNFWHYLLVDEYQDTNHAQYRWISLLSSKYQNICVVGDPDQSIYAWRGADLSNILNFEKEFPKAKVYFLEENYRSTQNILGAAQGVIQNNVLRKEKSIWSRKEKGDRLCVASLAGEREEAQFVISNILKHLENGFQYKDCAVFYRTNAQSRALEEALRQFRIPYAIYGGIRFYDRAEVKDAMAYLKALYNPADDISWKRIVNTPPRGIGKVTLEKIYQEASLRRCGLQEAMHAITDHNKLNQFKKVWGELRAIVQSKELSIVEMVREVLEKGGLVEYWRNLGTIEAEERLSNLNELVASVADFCESNPEATLTEYLDQVSLTTGLDEIGEEGSVSLMTLHLAKGLEFPCVTIVGLEEGLLPHSRSMEEPAELEEERRLFYVGMTRAMQHLALTQTWRRFLHGREQYSLPSRFLEEIPTEFIDKPAESSVKPRKSESVQISYEPEWDQSPPEENVAYPKGIAVRHPQFGVGRVASSKKTSQGEKVTIQFFDGFTRQLIAEYANLKKL